MNHAQEARDLLQPLQALAGKDAAFDLELAQVHATLALAEQQRITNVIAWGTANGTEPPVEVALQIVEALELGDPK